MWVDIGIDFRCSYVAEHLLKQKKFIRIIRLS